MLNKVLECNNVHLHCIYVFIYQVFMYTFEILPLVFPFYANVYLYSTASKYI